MFLSYKSLSPLMIPVDGSQWRHLTIQPFADGFVVLWSPHLRQRWIFDSSELFSIGGSSIEARLSLCSGFVWSIAGSQWLLAPSGRTWPMKLKLLSEPFDCLTKPTTRTITIGLLFDSVFLFVLEGTKRYSWSLEDSPWMCLHCQHIIWPFSRRCKTFLTSIFQVLHQNSYHYVQKNEQCRQNEYGEVDGSDVFQCSAAWNGIRNVSKASC